MPKLIRHIPIQSDGVPNPQALAPILSAAQPGTVTLVASNARLDSPLTQILLTLSLDIAKTRPTTFASLQFDESAIITRLYAAALGANFREYFRKSRNNAFSRPELEALRAASETKIDFVFQALIDDVFADKPIPSGGALVIDYAQCLLGSSSAEWMRERAKNRNVAVIAGLYLKARPDDPNAPIPGVMKFARLFIKNADAIFVLHDEDERRR